MLKIKDLEDKKLDTQKKFEPDRATGSGAMIKNASKVRLKLVNGVVHFRTKNRLKIYTKVPMKYAEIFVSLTREDTFIRYKNNIGFKKYFLPLFSHVFLPRCRKFL